MKRTFGFSGLLLGVVLGFGPVPIRPAFAQSAPSKTPAIKLPDGTTVFWAKTLDEANPSSEGVVLPPAEYKSLVEQAEQAKKLKPLTPSSVAIRGKFEIRGDRLIAVLQLTYSFRTSTPKSQIALGCQKGLLVAAKSGAGQLPILTPPTDDGLTLLSTSAGEQSLVLDVEVLVASRGSKNELGFELGLPRAAITTLKLDSAPGAGVKSISLGTRIAESAGLLVVKPEIKRTPASTENLMAKPVPVGATDWLEVQWEVSVVASANTAVVLPQIDAETTVRVEEAQIETVSKIRLRGNLKEWPLQLPTGTEVTIDRVGALFGTLLPPDASAPTLVRPSDPNKPFWLIRTPGEGNAEWLLTATARIPRPKPNEPKFRGPYPVGPFNYNGPAKQSGKVNIFASPGVRLSFKSPPEFRRQDLPSTAPDDHIAAFTYESLPTAPKIGKVPAWLELDARPAPTAIRAKSSHLLKLTPGGWRLDTTVRILPPPRGELEQILVEIPAEWATVEATPEELVEGVHIVKDGSPRLLAIRFQTPQKSAFTLKLLSNRPLPPKSGDERESKLALGLPRFPQTDERESSLVATVPEGFEVRGNVALWEAGQPSPVTDALIAPNSPDKVTAISSVSGVFDRAVARVDLGWQPYRPALVCENRVDVSLQPRQMLVQQQLKFKPSADDRRPVRLRGPEQIVGLQSMPPLEPVAPGVWEFRSPAEPGKEFTLTVAFALRGSDSTVSLLWPEFATRTDSQLRLWGGATGRRVNRTTGEWRELPNEAVAERDTWPLITLGASTAPAPLVFELSSLADSGLPSVWVERSIARVAFGESTAVVQQKFLLKRWLGISLELDLPKLDAIEIWVDGKIVEAVPREESPENWRVTVPLPEHKPNKPIPVELRYRYSSQRSAYREREAVPAKVRGAVYRTPLHWLILADTDTQAWIPGGTWEADYRWNWRGFGFGPLAAESPQDQDAWIFDGVESQEQDFASWPTQTTGSLAGRQAAPQSVAVLMIPKLGWIAGCSGAAFLLGLALAQLRRFALSSAVGAVAIGSCVVGVLFPHALAQVLAAAQPGLAILAIVSAGLAALRLVRERQRDRLPGFTRMANPIIPLSTPTIEPEPRTARGSVAAPLGPVESSSRPILTGG